VEVLKIPSKINSQYKTELMLSLALKLRRIELNCSSYVVMICMESRSIGCSFSYFVRVRSFWNMAVDPSIVVMVRVYGLVLLNWNIELKTS
jgi:hypothetical protein